VTGQFQGGDPGRIQRRPHGAAFTRGIAKPITCDHVSGDLHEEAVALVEVSVIPVPQAPGEPERGRQDHEDQAEARGRPGRHTHRLPGYTDAVMHGGLRATLLRRARVWWWKWWLSLGRWPVLRNVRGQQLRRLAPLRDGAPRGTPVVRYYWRRFLEAHAADVRGRCVEIGSAAAVRSVNRSAQADVIDLAPRDGVTIVADISRADHVPPDTYDCAIVPFTMHLIYDVDAALHHLLRILKPGGVLLVNFPCVDFYFADGLDMGTGAPLFVHHWFTPIEVENRMRTAGLAATDFTARVDGNLFARVAYQMNLSTEELSPEERDHVDAGHPLLVCVRAVKPAQWAPPRPAYRDGWVPPSTPARWSDRDGHYARP
jgi:SAM-dependent methyltransferase